MGHKRTRSKWQRLRMAMGWLPTYEGANLVKGYKKKFAVDLLTAISDLQDLGVTLDPNYIDAVKRGEELRFKQLHEKKEARLMVHRDTEIYMYEELDLDDEYGYIDVMGSYCGNVESRVDTVKEPGKIM